MLSHNNSSITLSFLDLQEESPIGLSKTEAVLLGFETIVRVKWTVHCLYIFPMFGKYSKRRYFSLFSLRGFLSKDYPHSKLNKSFLLSINLQLIWPREASKYSTQEHWNRLASPLDWSITSLNGSPVFIKHSYRKISLLFSRKFHRNLHMDLSALCQENNEFVLKEKRNTCKSAGFIPQITHSNQNAS